LKDRKCGKARKRYRLLFFRRVKSFSMYLRRAILQRMLNVLNLSFNLLIKATNQADFLSLSLWCRSERRSRKENQKK